MGKIRVKTLGDEEQEKNQKNEDKKRQETKKVTKAPGMKGGERVVAVGPTEEELDAIDLKEEVKKEETEGKIEKKQVKKDKKAPHSQKYQNLLVTIDRSKIYNLNEALELLEKVQRNKFDETVELHVNTSAQGVSGNITLPHGTGKKTKVAVADDKLIETIEKGIIDFDILVAEPTMMAKLARVAKVLGPRGLMPNPKSGTISATPQDLVKKYEGGLVNFRTETKAPIIHLTVGKMSFGAKKLSDNIEALIAAIKKQNIVNATLKSTMSPGIKIKV